jgi:hypothetical protein
MSFCSSWIWGQKDQNRGSFSLIFPIEKCMTSCSASMLFFIDFFGDLKKYLKKKSISC